jgi:predicted permease
MLCALFRRRKLEGRLRDELQLHIDLLTEKNIRLGMLPAEARRRALIEVGGFEQTREAVRDARGFGVLEDIGRDLAYALRQLRRSPAFSAVVILTAALGIGANTAIFSVVEAVLLRALPYRDAARLVSPINVAKDTFINLRVGDFQYATWRDQATIFDGVAAYTGRRFTITGNGEPEELKVQVVTPGLLRVLGAAPVIGRDFAPGDEAPRGGQVAIISHALWKRRFGGDPSALAKSMTLDGKPYSIAGVLPPEFEFPENADVSVLVAMPEPMASANTGVTYFYSIVARLRRGVTTERAEADLTVINQRLEAACPKRFGPSPRAGARTQVIGLHDRLVGNVRPSLLALSGAVVLVLLISCVNISNLLLARAIARQKEIAVRMALGAGRSRMLRQLLTEGMLLASAGGLAGLALAFAGVKFLRAIAPADVPHVQQAHISGVALAFNLAIAVAVGILFGVAPLRSTCMVDPEAALKQTSRSAIGSCSHRRVENLLIVSETSVALILLAGAGLLIRTFVGLMAIPSGFQPDRVVTASTSLPHWKYPTAERLQAFQDALLSRAQAGPGVEAAGMVACPPYGGFVIMGPLQIEGRSATDPHAAGDTDNVAVNYAAGDYFKVMGIPILEGRALNSSDGPGRPPVAVVNQALAHQFFPNGRAVGSRIRVRGVTNWLEVVGVSGNVKQGGLASETRAEIVQAAAQAESGSSARTLVIRSAANPGVLIPWLRSEIARLDGEVPPPEIGTMPERMKSLASSQFFVMRLLALFASLAVILAAIGIYSVLVYSVERRAHEIGIRQALGASKTNIMRLVLGRGLRLSLAGAALGAAGSLGLTRYLQSLLYGVTPHDPATLAVGVALVVLVALAAAYLPARRAVRRDAVATLQAE